MLLSLFTLVQRSFCAASNGAIVKLLGSGWNKDFQVLANLSIDLTHHFGQNSHRPSVCLGVGHLNNCRNLSPPKDLTLLYRLRLILRDLLQQKSIDQRNSIGFSTSATDEQNTEWLELTLRSSKSNSGHARGHPDAHVHPDPDWCSFIQSGTPAPDKHQTVRE